MEDYAEETEFLERTVRRACSLRLCGAGAQTKGEGEVVTPTDLAMEERIVSWIRDEYPDDGILSEEASPGTPLSGRVWVIDPLDGTYGFFRGMPFYGTQAALTVDGKPVSAVIHLPQENGMYTAVKDGGAFLNGRRIRVKPEPGPGGPCVVFGDFLPEPGTAKRQARALCALALDVRHVRMPGSAAYGFAYLACGRTQGHMLFSGRAWDLMPGALLCREAGADIRVVRGGGAPCVMAAADEKMMDTLLRAAAEAEGGKDE